MKHSFAIYIFLLALLAACSPVAPTRSAPAAFAAQPTQVMEREAISQNAAMPAPTQAPAGTPMPTFAGTPGAPQTTNPLAFSPAGNKMVIKDAQIDLLVPDSAAALANVTALVGEVGGYIISSQTWYQDGYLYASLRLGLPSLSFETSLNRLRAIGQRVLKENAQGQDVTDQYIDMQSRLQNLEATAARVRDFLKDARTIEDSLRISQELSQLEAQIEQVKGQMRFVEGRTAYSTVTVNLVPEYPTPTPTATPTLTPTPTATPPWNPGDTFQDASAVLTQEAQGFVDAAIWVGMILGPWVLLVGLGFLAIRALTRKSPSRH